MIFHKAASIFTSLFLISTTWVLAQANVEDSISTKEYFPLVSDTLDITKNGYYLAKVTDERVNKVNNGYVQRDKVKKRLVFQDSLSAYVHSFIRPREQSKSLVPLFLSIEKLRIFSSTDGKIDDAQIYLKLIFFDGNTNEKVRTFERTVNYKKKTQPDFIAKVVGEAFKLSFIGLKAKTVSASQYPVAVQEPQHQDSVSAISDHHSKEEPQRRSHLIPLPLQKVEPQFSSYYLADVKDIRPVMENEGMVLAGAFNQKSEAKLENGLEGYLKSLVTSAPDHSKKPLVLYVKSFRISEEPSAFGEQGKLFLAANLVYDSAGIYKMVYQKTIWADSTLDGDITSVWPILVGQSIGKFFQEFDEASVASVEVAPEYLGLNSFYALNEIREEKNGYKNKYFWNGKELKKWKDFNAALESDADTVHSTFVIAKMLHYMGNASLAYGSALFVLSAVDFLLIEDKSLKNWYTGGDETSTILKFADKKAVIREGIVHVIGGIVCNVIGKVVLNKAIAQHNKGFADKVSLNIAPSLQNNGVDFRLNFLLGCR